MKEVKDVYRNRCYRNGPCLHGKPVKVKREDERDYYDRASRSYIYLECKLHQKYYTPSPLQIEEYEKYQSGLSTETFELPDLQLADQNGVWMTRSDDPECYEHKPYDEPKTCNICDIVCDIRDMEKYMREDGSCPYDDSPPKQIYWKIDDYDRPCQDFLHPLLLQDIGAMNRKRRRVAKAHIWKYLKEPKWMHKLINSGERMIDVWRRNYQPVKFYYNSFETIIQYIKHLPPEKKTRSLLRHIRKNIEKSPSFKELLRKSWYEEDLLDKINRIVTEAEEPRRRRR